MPLDPESYAEPETAVVVAVTAAAASPSLRKIVRRSAVYGLAGVLIAYDKAAGVAQSVATGVQKGVNSARKSVVSEASEPLPDATTPA